MSAHPLPDLAERIKAKSVPNEAGCWIWRGGMTSGGYGSQSWGGRSNVAAHRASYMAFHGPISKGMFICHKCDVPACVNPDHLFMGTHADNMHDKSVKGRARGGPEAPPGGKRICLSLAMAPATAKWLKQAARAADLSASKFVEGVLIRHKGGEA